MPPTNVFNPQYHNLHRSMGLMCVYRTRIDGRAEPLAHHGVQQPRTRRPGLLSYRKTLPHMPMLHLMQ